MRLYVRDTVRHPHATRTASSRSSTSPTASYWTGSAGSTGSKQLEGTGFYQYLCVFDEWPAMWDAVRHVLDAYNRTALTQGGKLRSDLDVLYLFTDPASRNTSCSRAARSSKE